MRFPEVRLFNYRVNRHAYLDIWRLFEYYFCLHHTLDDRCTSNRRVFAYTRYPSNRVHSTCLEIFIIIIITHAISVACRLHACRDLRRLGGWRKNIRNVVTFRVWKYYYIISPIQRSGYRSLYTLCVRKSVDLRVKTDDGGEGIGGGLFTLQPRAPRCGNAMKIHKYDESRFTGLLYGILHGFLPRLTPMISHDFIPALRDDARSIWSAGDQFTKIYSA